MRIFPLIKKPKTLVFLSILFILLLTRFYGLLISPPSPYWEEVALGYDAYSLLQTGKDHHGNSWPIVAFESFGDWKPSLYFYTLIPSIRLLGLSVVAVRLPAAISGLLIAIGIPILFKLIFSNYLSKRELRWLTLISFALATLNPWAIQFSRGGWEINLAVAMLLWGCIFWLGWLKSSLQKSSLFNVTMGFISGSLIGLSLYAQHSARLVAPLVVGWFMVWTIWYYYLKAKKLRLLALAQFLFAFLFILLMVIFPIVINFNSPIVQQRFAETSLFADGAAVKQSNKLRDQWGNSLPVRLATHRYVFSSMLVLQQLLSHFDINYLFVVGDNNPRHSSQFFGLFYPMDFFLVLTGLYYFSRKNRKVIVFLLGWILIGTLPASIGTGSPHALRSLFAMPAWIIIITVGVFQLFIFLNSLVKKTRLLNFIIAMLFLIYILQFLIYSFHQLRWYPNQTSSEWQYGYSQMLDIVSEYDSEYHKPIYITREQGRPAMYYWFFNRIDPVEIQAQNNIVKKDQGEYLTWKNIKFIDQANEITDQNYILAASPKFFQQLSSKTINQKRTINNLLNIPIWEIAIVSDNE